MKTSRHFTALLLLTAGVMPAQDQATPLANLARRADVVVRATVIAVTDPSPEWHRLRFRADAVLRGAVGLEFDLLEPAGACCGRSLFALQLGDERLLFLHRIANTQHPNGGARGVVPAVPAVVAHVVQALAAPKAAALAQLLAANLQHEEPRIADDAAHALATMPQLSLDATHRAAVAAALAGSVQRGSTRTAALAEVAIRLDDDTMLDVCLPIYLSTQRSDQAALLRRALGRARADEVADRLPLHFSANGDNALRAAELLSDLPATASRPALQRLLQAAPHPRVQLCLTECLLAAGLQPAELAPLVPEPVLRLAQRHHQRPRPLRVVRPTRP
jgi:Arc/MetJ family transcription regulator